MTAVEYRKLANQCYLMAREAKQGALDDPELSTRLLIAYHLEMAAKVAREAAEAKERQVMSGAETSPASEVREPQMDESHP
jgi:hypothetical protein